MPFRSATHGRTLLAVSALSSALLLAGCGSGSNSPPPQAVNPRADVPVAPSEPTPDTHPVGGQVSGLTDGMAVVLRNRGSDPLTITANGPFQFETRVADGAKYSASIDRQPDWQNCSVTAGSGTAKAAVESIAVDCTTAAATVALVAGSGQMGDAEGVGENAEFGNPSGLAVSSDGVLYVAEYYGSRIRSIASDGQTSLIAGDSIFGYHDGNGPSARFSMPAGLAFDAAGHLLVADTSNHVIRRVSPEGDVTTLAGTGGHSDSDGPVASATFHLPWDVHVDPSGDVLVADRGNHKIRRIRDGEVTTVTGNGSQGLVDGPAATAQLNTPMAIVTGADGSIYVADAGNHAIRRIAPDGEVSTLAGNGQQGTDDGLGAAARFSMPTALAIDARGNLFVADFMSNRIRRVSPGGEVSTLAGSGSMPGYQEGPADSAVFNRPAALVVDSDGSLLVSDYNNNRIRRITPVR